MPKINLSIVLCHVFSWVIAINLNHIDPCIPPTGRMYMSCHVVFDEHTFPLENPGSLFSSADIIGDITTKQKTTLNEWISGPNEQKALGRSPSFQFDACSSSVKASHEAMSDFAIDPCLTNTSSPLSAGAHAPTPADPKPSAVGSQEATGSAPGAFSPRAGSTQYCNKPNYGYFQSTSTKSR